MQLNHVLDNLPAAENPVEMAGKATHREEYIKRFPDHTESDVREAFVYRVIAGKGYEERGEHKLAARCFEQAAHTSREDLLTRLKMLNRAGKNYIAEGEDMEAALLDMKMVECLLDMRQTGEAKRKFDDATQGFDRHGYDLRGSHTYKLLKAQIEKAQQP